MPPADHQLRLLVRHSASPKDIALAEELLGHLRPLERFTSLDVWSDARIPAGQEARREIARAIQQADIALLLLSADFLASDGLVALEVPQLLERHRAHDLRVIPVLMRSCLWEVHPWLAELQPLPRDGRPIASVSGDERDRVLTELVREIVGLGTRSAGSPQRSDAAVVTTSHSSARWDFTEPTKERIAQLLRDAQPNHKGRVHRVKIGRLDNKMHSWLLKGAAEIARRRYGLVIDANFDEAADVCAALHGDDLLKYLSACSEYVAGVFPLLWHLRPMSPEEFEDRLNSIIAEDEKLAGRFAIQKGQWFLARTP